jgi:hypothetical protein
MFTCTAHVTIPPTMWAIAAVLGKGIVTVKGGHMSNYVFGTRLMYEDYLQAKSFEDSLRGEISVATRSVIATHQQLARDHIAVSESISSGMARGFERLSLDINSLADGVAELNATFEWGFSEVLTLLGGLNDALRELIRIAKTPTQTWAYEQFEAATDDDFKKHQAKMDSLIATLRDEAKQGLIKTLGDLASEVRRLTKCHSDQFPLAGAEPIAGVKSLIEKARQAAGGNTYYGYLDSLAICVSAMSAARKATEALREMHQRQLQRIEAEKRQQEAKELAARVALSEKARTTGAQALLFALGGFLCGISSIIGLILGLQSLSDFKKGEDQRDRGTTVAAVVISGLQVLFMALVFVCVIVAGIYGAITKGSRSIATVPAAAPRVGRLK